MKKLSMFCVLVLACVGAKAAVVDWSVSGTVSTVGYQVYLVGALSDTWTSVADIAADAATFGTKGTSGTVAKAGRIYTTGSQSLVSDSVTKTSGDVYFVIVTGNDATTYNYQKMQKQMEETTKALEEKEYEASAGGGVVKVKINGKKEVTEVHLDEEVVDKDDIEMLEDLIMAAMNEAIRMQDEDQKNSMGKITGGLGGGLPF